MLCATIRYEDHEEIARASELADLIELRLDLFQPADLKKLRTLCRKPVIFKLERLELSHLFALPDYVDLPHTTPASDLQALKAQFPSIKRICSYHDGEKTGDLELMYQQLRSKPAEIYKIATQAASSYDALRMVRFVQKNHCIGLCMGELGTPTRILGSYAKAPWTYAPLSNEHRTAPGQLLLSELRDIYHYRSHSPASSLYGLIGDPVDKSLSHRVHNGAFQKLGLEALYVKLRVKQEELSQTLPIMQEIGFQGVSVTMPLKELVTKHSGQVAVNTLAFRKDQILEWNTDGCGALDALERRGSVKGKTLLLIGAGGAAWGIALEAKKRGANLMIANRTFERAKALAAAVSGVAYPLEAMGPPSAYDCIINCTSVGMGEDRRSPVPSTTFLPGTVAMEIITMPQMTPFLLAAQERGCALIKGSEMFVEQAAGQYSHWFGKERMGEWREIVQTSLEEVIW